MSSLNPPLQPLRIPSGWEVVYNEFYQAEPSPAGMDQFLFNEDLFQASNRSTGVLLDLGWYPAGSLTGQFRVQVYQGDFAGEKLEERVSRSLGSVVEAINDMLARYAAA